MSQKLYLSHGSVFFGWVQIFLNDFSSKLAFLLELFNFSFNQFIVIFQAKFELCVHFYACINVDKRILCVLCIQKDSFLPFFLLSFERE